MHIYRSAYRQIAALAFAVWLLFACKPLQQSRLSDEPVKSANLSSRVGIGLVLFDDREDFRNAPNLIREMTAESGDFSRDFGLSSLTLATPSTQLSFDERFKNSGTFSGYLKESFEKLQGQSRPELFIYIASHGAHGAICRQCASDVKHQDFIKQIYESAREYDAANEVRIHIVYSACHSFSMADAIKEQQVLDPTREINLVAASAPEMFGHGNYLLSAQRGLIEMMQKVEPATLEKICAGCSPFVRMTKIMHSFGTLIQDNRTATVDWLRSYSTKTKIDQWTPSELDGAAEFAQSLNLNWKEQIAFLRQAIGKDTANLLLQLDSPLDFDRFTAAKKILEIKAAGEMSEKFPNQDLLALESRARREIVASLYANNSTLHLPSAQILRKGYADPKNVPQDYESYIRSAQNEYWRSFDPDLAYAADHLNEPESVRKLLRFAEMTEHDIISRIAQDKLDKVKDAAALLAVIDERVEWLEQVEPSKRGEGASGKFNALNSVIMRYIDISKDIPNSTEVLVRVMQVEGNGNFLSSAKRHLARYWESLPIVPSQGVTLYVRTVGLEKAYFKLKNQRDGVEALVDAAIADFDGANSSASFRVRLFGLMNQWQGQTPSDRIEKFLQEMMPRVREDVQSTLRSYPEKISSSYTLVSYLGDLPEALFDEPATKAAVLEFFGKLAGSEELQSMRRSYDFLAKIHDRLLARLTSKSAVAGPVAAKADLASKVEANVVGAAPEERSCSFLEAWFKKLTGR